MQIDDTYANLALSHRGVATMSTVHGGAGWQGNQALGVELTFSGVETPILAWRSSRYMCLGRMNLGGGSVSYLLLSGGTNQGAFSFDYYVFDAARLLTSNENYGLRVWDPQGRKTFDSAFRYMKPVANPANANVGSPESYNHGNGVWACAQGI